MGWVATLVTLVVLAMGICFTVIQQKALWAELKIARRERAEHPDPDRRPKAIRALLIVILLYGSLAAAFFAGWRAAGTAAGALSAVGVLLAWVVVGAVLAIKSAWVSRK